ncbi:MAG: hypothetical protein ACK40I_12095 [Tabrizicola sp.]
MPLASVRMPSYLEDRHVFGKGRGHQKRKRQRQGETGHRDPPIGLRGPEAGAGFIPPRRLCHAHVIVCRRSSSAVSLVAVPRYFDRLAASRIRLTASIR